MADRSRVIWGWPTQGWMLVGAWTAALVASLALVIATSGVDEAGLSLSARTAVRFAFIAFLPAFGASALGVFLPSRFTAWLISRRPYFGVAFAICHFAFLGTNLIRVWRVYGGDFSALRPPVAWLVGGVMYGFLVAMVVTSFPTPARRVGPRVWKLIHVTGCYMFLGQFLLSFGMRAMMSPSYIPWAALVVALIGLRMALVVRRYHERARSLGTSICRRVCGAD